MHAFDPDFIGVTADDADIDEMAQSFGVAVSTVDLPGGDYTMDHSAAVFLLNGARRSPLFSRRPLTVAPLAADLRRAAPHLGG